jgi:hypothetical protein
MLKSKPIFSGLFRRRIQFVEFNVTDFLFAINVRFNWLYSTNRLYCCSVNVFPKYLWVYTQAALKSGLLSLYHCQMYCSVAVRLYIEREWLLSLSYI